MNHRTLIGLMLASSLTSTLCAQVPLPNLYRYSVPDLDQRRAGLAGNGGMHCVPTSHANILCYLATHGFPPIYPNVTHPQGQIDYTDNTNNIMLLGIYMGTTAADGTNGDGCEEGLAQWIGPFWPLVTFSRTHGPDVTPWEMYFDTLAGGLVAPCYGRWSYNFSDDEYQRDGGHCVTFRGMEDLTFPIVFSSQYPTLAYRDPASDDGDLLRQSQFATTKYELRPFTQDFEYYGNETFWEVRTNSGDGKRRLLDSMTTIYPRFVMQPDSTGIHLSAAFNVFDSQPQMDTSESNIIAADFALSPTNVFVITQPPTGAASSLKLINIPADQVKGSLVLGGSGGLLAPGRRNEAYIFNNRQLRCIKRVGNTLVDEVTPLTIPTTVDAMIFDDLRDGPTLLMGDGSVREYPRGLGTPPPTNRTFANPPVFIGSNKRFVRGHNPSEYWCGPLTGNTIRKYGVAPDGSGRLITLDTVTIPVSGGQGITDFCPTDTGNLLVSRGGVLQEWARNPVSGAWAVLITSPFHNFANPGGRFSASRSRSDYDPAVHNNPRWNTNILNGEPSANEVPDCLADIGRVGAVAEPDGMTDNNDFIVFIDWFFTQNPAADIGMQGGIKGPDGLFDNNDFIVFITEFFTCG